LDKLELLIDNLEVAREDMKTRTLESVEVGIIPMINMIFNVSIVGRMNMR
jgi:hypothetical protein